MREKLSQLIQENTHMTIAESIQITKELLKIAEKMHKTVPGILVLFPDNIWIEKTMGEYQLFLDTNRIELTAATDSITAAKTIGFRAPELAVTDHTRIGKQTDYYSITAIFYYCLTGKKISRFQMFYSGIPNISDVIYRNCMDKRAVQLLYQILKKGLAPTLKNRYQSGKQMENDLIKLEKYVK